MAPGIIWVSSHVFHLPQPRDGVEELTVDKFCDWYENTHIQKVTSLSGVQRAARYEASLDGQSAPREELLHSIFEQSRFDMRISEDVDSSIFLATDEGPAKFVVSWSSDSASDVDVEALRKIEGCKRVRRFRVVAGSTLEHFQRRENGWEGREGSGLMLIEFEGEEIPVEKVRRVIGERGEVGWFRLKRVYGETKK
ncbi:hypothetical protein BU23DRAFT_574713 [Bimuria novae-zelandiae CBS 107.79]|uniref:EthD domain-containing protein n=1 Tax=Bimuria novae-zelandiae CBS 107.79 TaxID=1447943 RepID=A0A6A5UMS2_9PLEO|nr:hypothetical protein BU23DRAFT_574713 [Bimuria novae-zelandiae CBS 107.79]